MIQYIADNFDDYRKGNKTKLFNDISLKVLKDKEPNGIKGKLSRMIKTYSDVKKHNEKSGVERKDWEWYDKMDSVFGARENISPSYIANRESTGIEEEETLVEHKFSKKVKRNNVDTIALAILAMSETRERVWDKKIELEKEKMEKKHAVEMSKLENEKEKIRLEYELKMKEIELKLANNQS